VALYPYVDGRSYSWGDSPTPAHRRGILDVLVALHRVPPTALRHPVTDDFAVPHRDELELTYGNGHAGGESGPYATRTSKLLAENAHRIGRLLVRYDDLVTQSRRRPHRAVITHGEPHPGNTLLTSVGWVLVDWDTVMVAPAERDLWSLDPGDGSIIRAYADATGTRAWPPMLELYRLRWDLADIAAYVSQFRAPHSDSPDNEKSWDNLCSLIGHLPA